MNISTNQKPDNYLVWAILSTIFCCLPLGIVAIIKANKVDTLWTIGNHQEAFNASKDARNWTIATAISGLAVMLMYFLITFLAVLLG